MSVDFNPSEMYYSEDSTIFGLPHTEENTELIIIPVPWDLTCSFRRGTAKAYEKIYEFSFQIDLYNAETPDKWQKGIFLAKPNETIVKLNEELKPKVDLLREKLYKNIQAPELSREINTANEKAFAELQEQIRKYVQKNKKIALLGGEHSITYNAVKVLAESHKEFSIVQIDAHADLRNSYETLKYSHASVMNNILSIPEVKKIVNLGVRDYSHEEAERIKNDVRLYAPDFKAIRYELLAGESWKNVVEKFLQNIPTEDVYITFDIDGLDVPYCSGTGTPVPNGLTFAEALFFLREIAKHKNIIGFDLCEVAASDGNDLNYIIATHLLYKLCLFSL